MSGLPSKADLRSARSRVRVLDGFGIAARVFTAVCCGIDRAIKCLEAWGLQRGTAAITMSSGR
jgi:hypothetical protein